MDFIGRTDKHADTLRNPFLVTLIECESSSLMVPLIGIWHIPLMN